MSQQQQGRTLCYGGPYDGEWLEPLPIPAKVGDQMRAGRFVDGCYVLRCYTVHRRRRRRVVQRVSGVRWEWVQAAEPCR